MEQEVRRKHITTIQHYFDIERYEEAVITITSLLEAEPTDPDALYYMAVVLKSKNENTEARFLCQNAMEYGYDKEICLHFIGTTYQNEKNYKEAEQAYLQALEINPSSAETHASYGYLMLLAGFDEKAIMLLEEAMRLDPDSERINQYVLNYFFAKFDQSKQIFQIQHIMDTSGSEEQKLINLGLYHWLREDFKEAREFFKQAFLLDPTNNHLLEFLESLDETTHPLFLPHRFMQKIGGSAVVWIGFMAITFLLSILSLNLLLVVFATTYIIFAIYTWLAPLIYKWFVKGRLS